VSTLKPNKTKKKSHLSMGLMLEDVTDPLLDFWRSVSLLDNKRNRQRFARLAAKMVDEANMLDEDDQRVVFSVLLNVALVVGDVKVVEICLMRLPPIEIEEHDRRAGQLRDELLPGLIEAIEHCVSEGRVELSRLVLNHLVDSASLMTKMADLLTGTLTNDQHENTDEVRQLIEVKLAQSSYPWWREVFVDGEILAMVDQVRWLDPGVDWDRWRVRAGRFLALVRDGVNSSLGDESDREEFGKACAYVFVKGGRSCRNSKMFAEFNAMMVPFLTKPVRAAEHVAEMIRHQQQTNDAAGVANMPGARNLRPNHIDDRFLKMIDVLFEVAGENDRAWMVDILGHVPGIEQS